MSGKAGLQLSIFLPIFPPISTSLYPKEKNDHWERVVLALRPSDNRGGKTKNNKVKSHVTVAAEFMV